RFPCAPRHFVGAIDQVDCNFGNVRKRQYRVAAPIETRDRATAEGEFLDQRATHGLHDVALDLVTQAVGVDDLPAVVHHEYAVDLDLAGRAIDGYVSHHPDVSPHQLVLRVGHASTAHPRTDEA